MSKVALTAGQLSYWQKKLGGNASPGAIQGARQAKVGAAPKPAAPQGGPAIPFDPVLEQTVAGVNRNAGINAAEYDYSVGAAKSRFGIEDASDPFSRQALLNSHYDESKRNLSQGFTDRTNVINTGMAAQGQLFSSARGNAQQRSGQDYARDTAAAQHSYDAQTSGNANDYQDLLHELASRKINADAQGQDTASLAQAQALQNAIGTEPDPMEAPAPKAKKKKTSIGRANLQSIARKLNLR